MKIIFTNDYEINQKLNNITNVKSVLEIDTEDEKLNNESKDYILSLLKESKLKLF